MADEADLLLIAPATANCLAKLAHGMADDALTCIALALRPEARLLIAPAMNGKMWLHPATQANVITTDSSDWATNCPEYKVTAVQVSKVSQLSEWQRDYAQFNRTQIELAGQGSAEVTR